MSRWIVFDQAGADAVQHRSGSSPEIRTGGDQASEIISMALQSRGAVAVLPAAAGPNAVLIRIHARQAPPAPDASSKMAPAGFLGLSDTIDMDDEPEPPKKWWQKILD